MRFVSKWTTCTVQSTRDLTPEIREIVLRPEGTGVENYAAGSHVNVVVLIDGRPQTRSYSLVGDVNPQGYNPDGYNPQGYNPEGYRIAVRRAPDSRGGSQYMWSLRPGARIDASIPASLFEIDITPIIGIAGALMRRNADVELHYAVTSRHDAAFLGELSDLLGDRLIVHASDEGQRIDLDKTFGRLPPHASAVV